MKLHLAFISLLSSLSSFSQYHPAAGQTGTTAIYKDSSIIVNWANHVVEFNRGLQNIGNPNSGFTTFGDSTNSLGIAEGTSGDAFSLGDKGSIVLSFEHPIKNGMGVDFAVFENGFDDSFLELAHIEVSTDGITYIRIPSISLTTVNTQTGSFSSTNPTQIHNLAGKYRQGYGTPFDLEDIIDSTGINLDSINFVKIIDVVGSINSSLGTYDSQGNIINDPYPTEYESGGFDLDAVAVINENKFVGINKHTFLNINIYPNPTQIFFQINNTLNGLLEIYSLRGILIYSELIGLNEIVDVSQFEKGIYFIIFSNSEGIMKQKLIVN